ncbi:hypothetical protein [Absidia glauca]|uniref:Uncharacterized protein n=1 Tax=Absidia glauca TaxID=4829 RepID=A0A168PDJ5_ABSGL|nr:hypothetical protein [Absidia glauca]
MSTHAALTDFAADILPSLVTTGNPNAVNSVSDDDSVRVGFTRLKSLYEDLVDYVSRGGRQRRVQEVETLQAQVDNVTGSLQFLPVQAATALQDILGAQQQRMLSLGQEILTLDNSVEASRDSIKTDLIYLMEHNLLEGPLREFGWPTLDVCHDLHLPKQLVYMVTYPDGGPMTLDDTSNDKDATIRDLKEMVRQHQLALTGGATGGVAGGVLGGGGTRNLSISTKPRHEATVDEDSKMDGAGNSQQWIARYESLSAYLGFSQEEQLEELQAVLEGQALGWYSGLQNDVKKNLAKLKGRFLH